jgi:hypothetical protein
VIAFFDATVAQIIPELGKYKEMLNEKAKNMLDWNPRSGSDALVTTGESLIKFGLVKSL